MGNDFSAPLNRATAIAAANALAEEFGDGSAPPPQRVTPPPDGQPPERCTFIEPLPLQKDNSDQRFGRARTTYDHRIDAHAIRALRARARL